MVGKPLNELETKIGYSFRDKSLITMAMTHASYTNESKTESYERLEFLGDAVISLVTTEYVYEKNPGMTEGELSKLRLNIVKGKSETVYANALSLGDYLILGKGEEKNGRKNPKILEDAFEALVGALYLDGGYEIARSFTQPFIAEKMKSAKSSVGNEDYKTRLQELIQQGGKNERLDYVKVCESGPDHDKTFEVDAMLNSNVIGHGIGKSIKEAEKEAARQALILFGEKV